MWHRHSCLCSAAQPRIWFRLRRSVLLVFGFWARHEDFLRNRAAPKLIEDVVSAYSAPPREHFWWKAHAPPVKEPPGCDTQRSNEIPLRASRSGSGDGVLHRDDRMPPAGRGVF